MMSESVQAMVKRNDSYTPTAPLDEFVIAYREDDNLWWRISAGDQMNLFDAALERIEELEERINND